MSSKSENSPHRAALATPLLLLVTACASAPGGPGAVSEVTAVLRGYEAALNAGDVDQVVRLYAPDAVFMAQHRPPAVGAEAVRGAYAQIFAQIGLDIAFEVDEVVLVSDTVAYARTRSAGTTTIRATAQEVTEGNQELFVLRRAGADAPWRISRYIFSSTRPRAGSGPTDS